MLLESCGACGSNGAACTIRSSAQMMGKRAKWSGVMGEAIKKLDLALSCPSIWRFY